MIDSNGVRITIEERDKKSKENKLFQEIDRKLNQVGLKLSYGFISDDRLRCGTEAANKSGPHTFRHPKIYIDGFTDDKKHAKVRMIPYVFLPFDRDWVKSPDEANKMLQYIEDQTRVYNELCEMDWSGLYQVYEKTDPVLDSGRFQFSINNYSSAEITPIIEYLSKYYDVGGASGVEHIYGEGYKSDNRIVAMTKDLVYAKGHFAPAYYDLHIFEKDKEPMTVKHVLSSGSYTNFFFDGFVSDNGEKIEISLRSHLDPFYKCTDTYYAYGTIDVKDCLINTKISVYPFIFQERSSERGCCDPSERTERCGGYIYIITGKDLTKEEAIEYSKNGGKEPGLEDVSQEGSIKDTSFEEDDDKEL